jgi:pimeloyl-ACP methyl ester carboxylesterase
VCTTSTPNHHNMSNKPANEESIIKEYGISIREPKDTPVGITVFLPGTSILGIGPKLENYESTIDVLLEMNQLVVGFNRLSPNPFKSQESHNKMAEDVRDAVAAICALNKYPSLENKGYGIVGHSLGGKVALMVAAEFDRENVNRVIALDPTWKLLLLQFILDKVPEA